MSMIGLEDLEQMLVTQRHLTDSSRASGLGLQTYLSNLGLDPGAVVDFTSSYVETNMPASSATDQLSAATAMARALAMGVLLGRQGDRVPRGA